MSINKVLLMGNLGKEVIATTLSSGSKVCNLRVATSEFRKEQNGERIEVTEWHNVVVFGKTAEICESRLKKGDKIFVEGRLRTRKWTDKEGGQRVTTEVVANTVEFFNRKTTMAAEETQEVQEVVE